MFLHQRKKFANPLLQLHYSHNPVYLSNAQGVFMVEKDTHNKLLDCINNVAHIGHANQYYLNKVQDSIKELNTNCRFLYDSYWQTTYKLLKKFPKELCVVTYVNSGSEANDLALMMGKIYSKKKGMACLQDGYHGITTQVMKVSPYKWRNKSKVKKQEDVVVLPSPCSYRGKYKNFQNSTELYMQQVQQLIKQDTGVFISEMMQSCAGQVIPKKDYFKKLYSLLKHKNIVTIADQVQTGFGRIGSHFWAFQYYDVIPDIVTIGKAMGNGFPVSALVCTKQIAEAYQQQGIKLFSTFGGNPVAMSAVGALLDVMKSQKLQQNAKRTGEYLSKQFQKLKRYPFVGDSRGMGLFQGLQIVKDKIRCEPDGDIAQRIIKAARDRGVMISRDGVWNNILKIKPPMIFNEQHGKILIDCLQSIFAGISVPVPKL